MGSLVQFTVDIPDLPADPLAIAARLDGEPDLVVLWDATGEGTSFVACRAIAARNDLDPEPELGLDARDPSAARRPRWIGVIPYEAVRHAERRRACSDRRPRALFERPIWKRYGAVVEIAERVRVAGDDVEAVNALAGCLRRPRSAWDGAGFELGLRGPIEAPEAHRARIRRALDLIARGEIYEVNLARELRLDVHGDTLALLGALGTRTRAPYSGLLRLDGVSLLASSPELCLELSGDGIVWTSPIKGTRPRGDTPLRDAELVAELDADPKERAELTMVIDVERNDLGRIATTGSVRLGVPPHVETHPTLHHRVATVNAQLRAGVDRRALLEAMLPSGSVTGAPKLRAMEVIAELEAMRRGAYTGAFGFIGHDGGLCLAMAIRVLGIRGGVGQYLVGGGIVADSDPEREVEETLWKARHVLDLLPSGGALR